MLKKVLGPVDILLCVREFYVLMAIDAIKKTEMFKKSHEKWEDAYEKYKKKYVGQLAKAVYDYTVLAVAGEMRHGVRGANLCNAEIIQQSSRETAFHAARIYTAKSILDAAIVAFDCGEETILDEGHSCGQCDEEDCNGDECDNWEYPEPEPSKNKLRWNSGFGGRAWLKIAEAGLLLDTLGEIGFIDHCIDLSHNNSPYFDKHQAGIFFLANKDWYRDCLDYKRKSKALDLIATFPCSTRLNSLVERAVTLKILPEVTPKYGTLAESAVEFIMKYKPIVWGKRVLTTRLVKHHHAVRSLGALPGWRELKFVAPITRGRFSHTGDSMHCTRSYHCYSCNYKRVCVSSSCNAELCQGGCDYTRCSSKGCIIKISKKDEELKAKKLLDIVSIDPDLVELDLVEPDLLGGASVYGF